MELLNTIAKTSATNDLVSVHHRKTQHSGWLWPTWHNSGSLQTDWVKALRPTQPRTGHFRDVLPSQSLGLVL